MLSSNALPAGAADSTTSAPALFGIERIKALRAQRPGDGSLVYYQAPMHADLGEEDVSITELKSLVGRGLGLIPVRDIGFGAVRDDPSFQHVYAELAAEERRTADAPVTFRLRDPRLIPEGIAYDPRRKRHYVGSIAAHKIVVQDKRGAQRDFSCAADKLDTVLRLAVDAKRRQLFAVSTKRCGDQQPLVANRSSTSRAGCASARGRGANRSDGAGRNAAGPEVWVCSKCGGDQAAPKADAAAPAHPWKSGTGYRSACPCCGL